MRRAGWLLFGSVRLGGCLIGPPAFAQYNYALSFQTNTITVASNWVGNGTYVVGSNTFLNALIIQGGSLSNGAAVIGQLLGGSNNAVIVTGAGSVWSNRLDLIVGGAGARNALTISDGGAVFNDNATLGNSSAAQNNTITVSGDGALWLNRRSLLVGVSGSTNTLSIGPGGTVIASNAFIGFNASASGNVIHVSGGALYVTNRLGSGLLDVRRGTLSAQSGGSITLDRLNISPTGNVALASSRISVSGALTNRGTLTMIDSVGTFNGPVVNSGAWVTDPTTNLFSSSFIHTAGGFLSASAGDVFIFTNSATASGGFINRSTNNAAWDTEQATFLFNARLGLTQDFYAAGVDLGPPSASSTSPVTGEWAALTLNNFALGTLEIANFSTVRVWDAFSGLGGEFGTNDNARAALYVSNLLMGVNSFLLISSNVEVYFLTSNSWGAANFALLGVAVLWLAGAGSWYGRRLRDRCRSRAARRARRPANTGTSGCIRHRVRRRVRRRPEVLNLFRAIGQKYFWLNPDHNDYDIARPVERMPRRQRRRRRGGL